MIPLEKPIPDPSNQVHSRDAFSPSHDAANWATLYPELIYEILTYCLSGVTLSTGALGSFPWYLGHICRSWRSVFISSPRFWDRFMFEAVDQMEMAAIVHCERDLAVVESCIERTKDHPFSFELREPLFLDDAQWLHQILETLVPHADRWRVVCFQVADADRLKRSLTKAKRRFGQLHSLRICTPGVSDRHICSDVFQDAPNLTHVYATDYYQLPWSSIIILHIDGVYTSYRFFPNFDKMTCLEELVIKAFHFDHDAANGSPIELPSLKKISVDNFSLLSFIKAPALETLSLIGARLRDDGIPAAETLLRGVSRLKTLSFSVHNDGVERIIDCTPELDHLIITCYDTTFLEALRSLLQSLASRSTARSLRRINVGVRDLRSSAPAMDVLAIIKSWEKHQFPKLCFVSVHINDNRGVEDIISAADLTWVGADKEFEIDVKSSPLPMTFEIS